MRQIELLRSVSSLGLMREAQRKPSRVEQTAYTAGTGDHGSAVWVTTQYTPDPPSAARELLDAQLAYLSGQTAVWGGRREARNQLKKQLWVWMYGGDLPAHLAP